MVDWNQPDNSSSYTTVLSTLRSLAAAAGGLNYASDTNIPDGLLKYDRSTKKFYERQSGVWVAVQITGLTGENIAFDAGKGPDILSATFGAAGSNQSGATALTYLIAYVTSGTGGVKLVAGATGEVRTVVNLTASFIKVYPESGATINSLAANTPVNIGPGQFLTFHCRAAATWNTPKNSWFDITASGVVNCAAGTCDAYTFNQLKYKMLDDICFVAWDFKFNNKSSGSILAQVNAGADFPIPYSFYGGGRDEWSTTYGKNNGTESIISVNFASGGVINFKPINASWAITATQTHEAYGQGFFRMA